MWYKNNSLRLGLDCVLDVESESFTLANVMEAPLLKNKEDVEVPSVKYTFIA